MGLPPLTLSDNIVELLLTTNVAFPASRVLVIVQVTTSPSTGVIVPGTLVGKLVVTPLVPLTHARTGVYCVKLPGPDMISSSE